MKISAHQATRSRISGKLCFASGPPEHQIIDAGFARLHGVVAGDDAADANDMFRFHRLERGVQRLAQRADMHAVGFDPRRQLRVADETGDAALLR